MSTSLIFHWILENKEWLFSGLGILVITSAWAFYRFLNRPSAPAYKKTYFTGDHKWSYEDRTHNIEIFYPQPFKYKPNLILHFPDKHFAPRGTRFDHPQKGAREPIYKLIEQRQDGFIIEICSLGQYGPSLKWKAQGIVS